MPSAICGNVLELCLNSLCDHIVDKVSRFLIQQKHVAMNIQDISIRVKL